MLAHGLEVAFAGGLERGDHVALEEVCAGGEGDWVGDAGLEVGGLGGEEVKSLEDGCGTGLLKEEDERFDGGDGHGKVSILGEEAVVGVDNAFILHVSDGSSS